MAVSDYLRAAKAAWDRKEWGSCWKFSNDALNEEPDSPEALYLAGCALREIGNIGLAATLYRRALAMRPGLDRKRLPARCSQRGPLLPTRALRRFHCREG